MAMTKTWIVNSANSRHPQMDGDTVPVFTPFSNGMQYPGDPAGGADEAAGCKCSMVLEGEARSRGKRPDNPELDARLREGNIENRAQVGQGTSGAELAKIDDLQVVVKNNAGRTSAANNATAQMMNDQLRLVRMPRTVYRVTDDGVDIVSVYVDDAQSFATAVAESESASATMLESGWAAEADRRGMILFDRIVGNYDRNFGNLLKDANGKLWGIDHDIIGYQTSAHPLRLGVVGPTETFKLTAADRGLLQGIVGNEESLRRSWMASTAELGDVSGVAANFRTMMKNVKAILEAGEF